MHEFRFDVPNIRARLFLDKTAAADGAREREYTRLIWIGISAEM